MPENEQFEWVSRLAETFRGARFGHGVVGKSTYAMIALLVVWGVIAWRLPSDIAPSILLLMSGLIPTASFLWWLNSIQQFAERNPAQAMLEGAQFLEHQKFAVQAKGLPPLTAGTTVVPNPERQQIIDPDDKPEVE